jgi:hypothetical protein
MYYDIQHINCPDCPEGGLGSRRRRSTLPQENL